MKETRDGKSMDKRGEKRHKSAENEKQLWVRRIQMEEEKVECRVGRAERRNEVTGGIESE